MSFKGNDMLLRVLAESIKKEKLEEFKINFSQEELDDTKSSTEKKKKLSIPTTKSWKSEYHDNLKNLLAKNTPVLELTPEDINQLKLVTSDEELINFARWVQRSTTDNDLKDTIEKHIQSLFGNKYNSNTSDAASGKIDDDKLDNKKRDIKLTPYKTTGLHSISHPRVMVSDASMAKGKFFGSQNDLVNAIFDQGTIKERCAAFTEVSKRVFDLDPEEVKTQKDIRDTMQAIMFLDLCSAFFNEIDSRAVGYSFESLCAIICGGTVIGGGNGAADFKTSGDAYGSSKKYGSWSGITQAASGFSLNEKDDKSKSLHYIIGMPSYGVTKGKVPKDVEGVKLSNPDAKVIKVKLYYIIIDLVEVDNAGNGTFITKNGDGDYLAQQVVNIKSTKKINIIKDATPDKCFVGEFQVYGVEGGKAKSLNQVLTGKTTGKKDNMSEAFDAVKKYFSELIKVEEASKKYINIKNDAKPKEIVDQGNLALETMTTADKMLEDVIKLLRPEGTNYSKKDRELSENVVNESRKLTDVIREMKEKELKKR